MVSYKKGFFFLEITLQREQPQSAMCALLLSLCSCSIKVVWKLQLCVHCHSVLEVRGKVMICKVDPSVILSLEVQFCRFCCQPVFRVQRVLHDLKAAAGNSQFKPWIFTYLCSLQRSKYAMNKSYYVWNCTYSIIKPQDCGAVSGFILVSIWA